MMELKVGLWTMGLFCLVAYWVYANSRLEIDYERHIQLVDQETGAKHKPSELLDLAKIIHHTPSYINSTNAIERLYDSSYLATFENPFVIDQSYSSARELQLSGWPVANAAHCTSELAWIRAELARLAANDSTASGGGYWTARGQLGYDLTNFMDSFGRPEAGFFAGSIHWLGSYKQCLQAGVGKQLRARYCIAKMRFKSWPQHENIYPETRIRVGVCLPESCDTLAYYASAATRQHINELSMFNLPEKLSSQLETDALVCLPDERSPLRRVPPGGRVLLVAVGAWLALVFAATVVYESIIRHDQLRRRRQQLEERKPTSLLGANHEKYCTQDTTMTTTTKTSRRALLEQIISAISIRNSIKTFKTNAFRVKHRDGQRVRLNLGALDFFKANMTLMVVLAHAGYLATTHARSISNRIEISAGDLGFMGMSVARCVDTFFLFFGILTSYNVLKKFPEERQLANPLVWLAVNVGIFIRVAPIFMLVFWYAKLLAPSVGSGPWWDYAIDHRTIRGTCRDESWWKSIPYFGCSGKPGVPACNLPSWFIVSYSQLSLLMPPITYLLYKLPAGRAPRLLLVGGLLAASAGSIGWRLAKQTSVREDGLTLYGAFLADLLEKFESTGHLTTLGRLGVVTAGCLVGYLLRAYEEGRIRVWPKWVTSVWINWACALTLIAMAMLPFAGHRIHLLTGRLASLNEFVATNVVLIFVWPILVSVLVVSCVTTYNHTVWMRFLSHSFWHVFNRLGLCVFLIHWEVLYTVITAYEHAPTYGFMADIMKLWAFGVFFSLILALPMHILIEAPIASLLMIVYRRLARNPSVQLTSAAMLIKQASAQPTAATTEKVSTTSNADYVQALQHCC